MALSRLRHTLLISRASSLYKARILSARTLVGCSRHHLLSRDSNVLDSDAGFPRPLSSFLVAKSQNGCSTLKLGLRHFSSGDSPPHTVIGMPALSPTMTQGNIATWKKKEGDKIEVGDVLCEIETDKATLEFECLEEGFLAKILAPGGSKDVPVGQPIAIMVEELEDIQKVPDLVSGGSEGKEGIPTTQDVTSTTQQTSPNEISTADLPPHAVIGMPALSPTMNQGNIYKWRKKEGDRIEVGDVICEIETDKATLEFESLEEGYLAKILAPEGSKDVEVGEPICITVEDESDIEILKNSSSTGAIVKKDKPQPTQHDTAMAGTQVSNYTRISPSAKSLITEFGLDASLVQASGPRGTMLKGDVLAAIKSGKAVSAPKEKKPSAQSHPKPSAVSAQARPNLEHSDSFEDIPNSQIRKVIARRLLESKQGTPHLYLSSDVVLDPLLSFRKELKEKHDVKVSVNDIVIKAVAVALRNVPKANAYWNAENEETSLCESVDISIAVATEKGLMTPIIRNADQKTISAISAEVKELAEKARTGKLTPNEFQGGTFSISNLGMFPVDKFCAIINPPQACILAVGRGNRVVEPVIGSDGIEKPTAVTKMSLTLSADHRVYDGEVAAAFLSALRLNFSDITRLIL